MQLNELLTDGEAVSPVIGVILMVSITVVLAATVGTMAMSFGEEIEQTPPSANLEYDYTTEAADKVFLNVTHVGGEALANDTIDLRASDSGGFGATAYQNPGGTYAAGDRLINTSVTGTPVTSGETIRVVWAADGGQQTSVLSSSTVPSS
jgi:flagellin-like protein